MFHKQWYYLTDDGHKFEVNTWSVEELITITKNDKNTISIPYDVFKDIMNRHFLPVPKKDVIK